MAADCEWILGPKKIQNNGQTTKPGKSGIKRIYCSHLFQLILYINTHTRTHTYIYIYLFISLLFTRSFISFSICSSLTLTLQVHDKEGGQAPAQCGNWNRPDIGDTTEWIMIIPWNPQKSKGVPSGKHTKNYGKSPCSMGKSTISMAIFNSYVTNYQRAHVCWHFLWDNGCTCH